MFSSNHSKSPKPHSRQQQRHRDLYKTSPNWQQIYKKQCLTQLTERRNETRSRLIDRFRNIDINDTTFAQKLDNELDSERHQMVEQVMQTVWNQYNTQLPHINSSDITDLMEQIRQELLIEEGQYWEELMEWRKEAEVEWLVSNRDSVVCFFCQKNPLLINALNDNKTQLICTKCEFNFTAQFSFSLAYLQERVDHIIGQHSSLCPNTKLKFNLVNDCSNEGYNNISVSCDFKGKERMRNQRFRKLFIKRKKF